MNNWLFLFPLISAFIGWVINRIALKMLFHPRLPMKILGFTIQGIFPKQQPQFAEKMGKLVSEELFSLDDIAGKISNEENVEKILPHIEVHIDNFLRVKLKEKMPVISMFIGDKTINEMKAVFMNELKELFPVIINNFVSNLKSDLDLEKIVTEKVAGFSSDKVEELFKQNISKKFQILGGVMGFIIGLLQVLLTVLIK